MLKLSSQLEWPTGIGMTLRGVFDWWISELTAIVPLALREALVPSRVELQDVSDANDVALVRPDGTRLSLVGLAPAGPISAKSGEPRAKSKNSEEAAICLAPDRALRTIATLPLAAQNNLDQVIAFEFERLVPFRRDESYFAYRVLGRNKASRSLQFELAVVPRAAIDRLIQLAEAHGLRVVTVVLAGATPEDPPISLPFAGGDKAVRRSTARLVIGALSTLVLLLAILSLTIPYIQQQRTLEALTKQVDEARRRANLNIDLKKQIESEHSTQTLLIRRRNRTPTIADVLDAVTRITPDGTWLTELRVTGTSIELFGLSPSPSNLLRLIDRSPHFRNAAFVSPVTRDAQLDRERFAISAQIAPKGSK